MIFQSLHQQLLYSYHTLCDMAGKMNFERHVVSLGRCSLISGDYSRAYIRATTGEPPTAAESCIDESVSERPSFNSNFNSSFNESNSCFSKRDSVIQWLLQYKHPNNSWCSKKVIGNKCLQHYMFSSRFFTLNARESCQCYFWSVLQMVYFSDRQCM